MSEVALAAASKNEQAALHMKVDPAALARFRRDLDPLIDPSLPVGLAVSGGPDSLALLILAAEARPGMVEVATVDHSLRADGRAEAEQVAALCESLGVPHQILTVDWPDPPETAIQERARAARYRLLTAWANERGLSGLLTAHHIDDQVETFFMRLARGSGVRGLAGMRRRITVPGGKLALVRPLLGWRRNKLEEVCAEAGVTPVEDPSNADQRFERVRVRQALADSSWLDPQSIARSAENLAQADAALSWAATQEWERAVTNGEGQIVYRPSDAPKEIRLRIVRRAVLRLASEGAGAELRGGELDRLLLALASGRTSTLRGVLCSGGVEWRFANAPPRKANSKVGH